jgi:hypothetical protein
MTARMMAAVAMTGFLSGCFAWITPAAAQQKPDAAFAYSKFDAKTCRHVRGRDAEDYGTWTCAGHDGVAVRLSGGDQRMSVSFGRDAAREPAARQTFPAFNNVYNGTIEWRLDTPPNGKPRAFATILRWNVRLKDDERTSTGRVLVVTRLGPDGVCHVGYVDARTNPDANALARQIANERARAFNCGTDKPVVLGKTSAGLSMPRGE